MPDASRARRLDSCHAMSCMTRATLQDGQLTVYSIIPLAPTLI